MYGKTKKDAGAVFRHWEQLQAERYPYEYTLRELAKFISPRKSLVLQRRSMGSNQMAGVFDSTAIDACHQLTAAIAGSLTNPASRWFRLTLRDEMLNQQRDAMLWLLEASNRMYLQFAQSNFHQENVELIADLGTFGFGAMYVEEAEVMASRFGGIRFITLAPGEYWICEDANGLVDTLYRSFKLPADAVVRRWGAGSTHVEKLMAVNPYQPIDILHVCYPLHERQAEDPEWCNDYYVVEDKYQLAEGRFNEFPFMVPRWAKSSGETYGRGPGHIALPDIKSLNRAKELTFKAWAKAISPPLLTLDDGVIGNLNLVPDGTTSVRSMDAVAPLEMKSRFDVSFMSEDRLADNIRKMFFNHQIQLPDKQYMTATEVERTLEQIHKILGPTIGRANFEYLTPLIKRTFAIMARAGEIPPPPPVVLEAIMAGQGELGVEFEGPLTRAQRSNGMQAMERFFAGLVGVAQVDPSSIDKVDCDVAVDEIAAATGVTPVLLRDVKRVQEIRAQRQAKQEQMEQDQRTLNMAQTVKNMAPALQAAQGLVPGAGAQPAGELPTSGSDAIPA